MISDYSPNNKNLRAIQKINGGFYVEFVTNKLAS
jgi:uncharacterized protein (DUF2164 family)